MSISQRLAELGVELPEVVTPVAAYVPAILVPGTTLVQTSGQLPMAKGKMIMTGHVGTAPDLVSPEDAARAARLCALNAVAAAAATVGGVDKLVSVVKVTGFVSSHPEFTGQAGVLNGASEFLGDIFGSAHARAAVGMAVLPLDAPVEIEILFEYRA